MTLAGFFHFMTNTAIDLKKLQSELNKGFFDTEKNDDSKKRAEYERRRDLNDIRHVISTPQGRRSYWKILEVCQVYNSTYVHGDQGYGTTYNAGRQSVGQELIRDLEEAKPGIIYQMALEAHAEKQRNVTEEE